MWLFLCRNGALKSLSLLARWTSSSVLSDALTATCFPAPRFLPFFPPLINSQPPSQTKATNCKNNGETLSYPHHFAPSCSFFDFLSESGFSCLACMCASIGSPSMLLCVGHPLPQWRLSERCARTTQWRGVRETLRHWDAIEVSNFGQEGTMVLRGASKTCMKLEQFPSFSLFS